MLLSRWLSLARTSIPTDDHSSRYERCDVLEKQGISSATWLDDALACYGSDTLVWGFNLVVKVPSEAAGVLAKFGYQSIAPGPRIEGISLINEGYSRLTFT